MSKLPYRYTEFADGSTIEMVSAHDGLDGVWAWETTPGKYTIRQVLNRFTDPNKTARITCHIGERADTWTGYTEFAEIKQEPNGQIKVRVRRPAEE